MFTSQRFWLTIAAIATAVGSFFGGTITTIQLIIAIVTALGTLNISYGIRAPGVGK